MRSRYSAFCVGAADYLRFSWDRTTRPVLLDLDLDCVWQRLEVLATELGGVDDQRGIVEFRATYCDAGGVGAMREVSQFRREDGRWVYEKAIANRSPSTGQTGD